MTGAATTAGIDYQHRVGAYVLTQLIAGVTDYRLLQIEGRRQVTALRFETADAIDDLVLETDAGRIYVQAKRTISFSTRNDSELSSVIDQFVQQFVSNFDVRDAYVLATTSAASSRITKELRKLTEALRLNEAGAAANPLTKAEVDVQEGVRELIRLSYRSVKQREPEPAQISDIFARIRVGVLDLEADEAGAGVATITLPKERGRSGPALGSFINALHVPGKAACIYRQGRVAKSHWAFPSRQGR